MFIGHLQRVHDALKLEPGMLIWDADCLDALLLVVAEEVFTPSPRPIHSSLASAWIASLRSQ
jgi:hypothetical protein